MRDALARVGLWTLAILFPCAVLGSPNLHFCVDWVNNLWFVSHYANVLQHTGGSPTSFLTAELGGVPYPVFYGYLLYPLLGVLGTVMSAENVFRVAVIGVFALQFLLVRRAVLNGGGTEPLATATACLVVWAIYPL